MILRYKYPELRVLNCSNAKNTLKATCSVYAPLKYIKKKGISLCLGGETLILQTANRPALAHRYSHNLQNKNRISWMFEIRCFHLSFFIWRGKWNLGKALTYWKICLNLHEKIYLYFHFEVKLLFKLLFFACAIQTYKFKL